MRLKPLFCVFLGGIPCCHIAFVNQGSVEYVLVRDADFKETTGELVQGEGCSLGGDRGPLDAAINRLLRSYPKVRDVTIEKYYKPDSGVECFRVTAKR